MNRHQQRVTLLFGVLMIGAALLGRANATELHPVDGAAAERVAVW